MRTSKTCNSVVLHYCIHTAATVVWTLVLITFISKLIAFHFIIVYYFIFCRGRLHCIFCMHSEWHLFEFFILCRWNVPLPLKSIFKGPIFLNFVYSTFIFVVWLPFCSWWTADKSLLEVLARECLFGEIWRFKLFQYVLLKKSSFLMHFPHILHKIRSSSSSLSVLLLRVYQQFHAFQVSFQIRESSGNGEFPAPSRKSCVNVIAFTLKTFQ